MGLLLRQVETEWFVAKLVFDPGRASYVTLRLRPDSALWFGSDGWLVNCRFKDMDSALATAEELDPMISEAWKLELARADAVRRFIDHVYSHTQVSPEGVTWNPQAKALVAI